MRWGGWRRREGERAAAGRRQRRRRGRRGERAQRERAPRRRQREMRQLFLPFAMTQPGDGNAARGGGGEGEGGPKDDLRAAAPEQRRCGRTDARDPMVLFSRGGPDSRVCVCYGVAPRPSGAAPRSTTTPPPRRRVEFTTRADAHSTTRDRPPTDRHAGRGRTDGGAVRAPPP